MAGSEFYMQCEDDIITLCQSKTGETNLVACGSGEQNQLVSVSSAPSDRSPAVSPPSGAVQASGLGGVQTILPVVAAPVVAKQAFPSVMQPIQMAAGGTPGQHLYIASQTPPGTPQSLTTPVGYILPSVTGQSVTFLSPAQAGQFIVSQLASQSGNAKAAAPGKYTFQIPVSLTIHAPSGIQNGASTGMPALGPSPSNLPPVSSSADSGHVNMPPPTVPPAAAAEVISPSVLPSEVVTVPTALPNPTVPVVAVNQAILTNMLSKDVLKPVSTFEDPAPVFTHSVPAPVSTLPPAVLTHSVPDPSSSLPVSVKLPTQMSTRNLYKTLPVLAPKPEVEKPAPSAIVAQVFQGASRPPQTCSVCGASYKAVQCLRGYLCRCNQKLIKNIQALSVHPRKRKTRGVSHRRPIYPSSSSTSASVRHSSASPPPSASVIHITTSEIPEGAPSPGTGDYDQHGKLIILVEDFYYGKDPGQPVLKENNQVPIMMKCFLCDKKLKNNIKLMNHMKHHMEIEFQNGDVDNHTVCQHCFRNFSTPFTLQCHVETVHSQIESTAICKICELSFENEPLFLNHMKNTHKPGEMPYMCQVCSFRSSFYNDVLVHFRELHKDTNNLQCTYCLKVFKSSSSFQLHYNKHQKKSVQHCDKCRLQFLYSKDRVEHKALFHQTHLKPVQLLGLKPGTRVTIRAYTVTRVDDGSGFKASCTKAQSQPLKVSPASFQKITPTKRKPVESLLELMTKFQSQCEPASKKFCIECNFEIPDYSSHFPTFVHCSLCQYRTCCSRAYANHMISYHVPRKTTTKYLNLYKPCPKLGQLSCYSCDYTTEVGDSMAKHLVAHPSHYSSHSRISDGFSRGYKRFVYIPTDLIRPDQRTNMPVHVVQVDQHSPSDSSNPATQPNKCVNLTTGSAYPPSVSVQEKLDDQTPQNGDLSTGAHTQLEHTMGRSLTLAQLKIVLFALCFGVPEASNHFDTPPEEVHSLLLKRQLQHGHAKRGQSLIPQACDGLVEWVLCQREQQLPVNECKLFSKASEIISKDSGPKISFEWAVDFLLQHNLGLQALTTSSHLPPKAQEHVQTFIRFMTEQVKTQGFAQSSIGAMDELSIFIDLEQLDPASADSVSMMSAFKLVGESDPLMDIVLVGLADGTMLPTMVFLKGEPLSPDAPSLPDFIVLEAKPEGFSDEERLQLWFEKVWHRYVDPSSGGKALLVMDTYRGHLTDDFLAALNSANTLPGLVPRACSYHLQPLETCIGPVLRELLRGRWNQHVTEAPHDLIGVEPADLALLISTWLTEMLDVIAAKPALLKHSFDKLMSSFTNIKPTELSALVYSLTETLLTTLQGKEAEEEESGENSNTSITSPSPPPSPPANPQALKGIFEKDSDLESFLGF